MKFTLLISTLLLANVALARDYDCTGVDRSDKNKDVEMNLQKISSDKLTVINPDGDEIELNRARRKNESKFKFAIYQDITYDGYGGSVKVSIPQAVARGNSKSASFTTFYKHTTYSEIGKVGDIDVKATCEPAKDSK